MDNSTDSSKFSRERRVVKAVSFFLIFSVLVSCEKQEELPCKDCGSVLDGTAKAKSLYKNKYFQFAYNSKFEPQLYLLDTINLTTSTAYGFCKFVEDDGLNQIDVIKADGGVYWACNKVDTFLMVKKYSVPNSCATTIPIIHKEFPLTDRYWYLDTLSLNGKIFLQPCGYESGIKFTSSGKFDVYQVVNSMTGKFVTKGSDSLNLTITAITLSIARTPYQRDFENNLTDAVLDSRIPTLRGSAKYTIVDNQLKINVKKGWMKFHCLN